MPRPSGGEWTRSDWANWRNRVWRPAAQAAGVTGDMRPLPVASLVRLAAVVGGPPLTYVAEQAGHSIATLAKHYAGTIRELEDQPRIPAADAIRQAREQIRQAKAG